MSIRDDIISIKNGLVTLGEAIENLSVHASADEQVVNSSKSINFAGTDKNPGGIPCPDSPSECNFSGSCTQQWG